MPPQRNRWSDLSRSPVGSFILNRHRDYGGRFLRKSPIPSADMSRRRGSQSTQSSVGSDVVESQNKDQAMDQDLQLMGDAEAEQVTEESTVVVTAPQVLLAQCETNIHQPSPHLSTPEVESNPLESPLTKDDDVQVDQDLPMEEVAQDDSQPKTVIDEGEEEMIPVISAAIVADVEKYRQMARRGEPGYVPPPPFISRKATPSSFFPNDKIPPVEQVAHELRLQNRGISGNPFQGYPKRNDGWTRVEDVIQNQFKPHNNPSSNKTSQEEYNSDRNKFTFTKNASSLTNESVPEPDDHPPKTIKGPNRFYSTYLPESFPYSRVLAEVRHPSGISPDQYQSERYFGPEGKDQNKAPTEPRLVLETTSEKQVSDQPQDLIPLSFTAVRTERDESNSTSTEGLNNEPVLSRNSTPGPSGLTESERIRRDPAVSRNMTPGLSDLTASERVKGASGIMEPEKDLMNVDADGKSKPKSRFTDAFELPYNLPIPQYVDEDPNIVDVRIDSRNPLIQVRSSLGLKNEIPIVMPLSAATRKMSFRELVAKYDFQGVGGEPMSKRTVAYAQPRTERCLKWLGTDKRRTVKGLPGYPINGRFGKDPREPVMRHPPLPADIPLPIPQLHVTWDDIEGLQPSVDSEKIIFGPQYRSMDIIATLNHVHEKIISEAPKSFFEKRKAPGDDTGSEEEAEQLRKKRKTRQNNEVTGEPLKKRKSNERRRKQKPSKTPKYVRSESVLARILPHTDKYFEEPLDKEFPIRFGRSLVSLRLKEMIFDGNWDPSTKKISNFFINEFILSRKNIAEAPRSIDSWKYVHEYLRGMEILPLNECRVDVNFTDELEMLRMIQLDAKYYGFPILENMIQCEINSVERERKDDKLLEEENRSKKGKGKETEIQMERSHPRLEVGKPKVYSIETNFNSESLDKFESALRLDETGLHIRLSDGQRKPVQLTLRGGYVRCWIHENRTMSFEVPDEVFHQTSKRVRKLDANFEIKRQMAVNEFSVDNYRETAEGLCRLHGFHLHPKGRKLSPEEMEIEFERQKKDRLSPLEDALISLRASGTNSHGHRGYCVSLQAKVMVVTFVRVGDTHVLSPTLIDGDFTIVEDADLPDFLSWTKCKRDGSMELLPLAETKKEQHERALSKKRRLDPTFGYYTIDS